MNVTESNAVFTLLRWLGADQALDDRIVTHQEAGKALAALGERAGQRLQLTVREEPVVDAVVRFGAVVTAARRVVDVADEGVIEGGVDALDGLRWAIHDCKARG